MTEHVVISVPFLRSQNSNPINKIAISFVMTVFV
jgi:hypothetical protein